MSAAQETWCPRLVPEAPAAVGGVGCRKGDMVQVTAGSSKTDQWRSSRCRGQLVSLGLQAGAARPPRAGLHPPWGPSHGSCCPLG